MAVHPDYTSSWEHLDMFERNIARANGLGKETKMTNGTITSFSDWKSRPAVLRKQNVMMDGRYNQYYLVLAIVFGVVGGTIICINAIEIATIKSFRFSMAFLLEVVIGGTMTACANHFFRLAKRS